MMTETMTGGTTGTTTDRIYIPEDERSVAPASQIGATLEALAATIAARRDGGDEASYTYRLLNGIVDDAAKKLMEEAGEVALAVKDADYAVYFAEEAADVAVESDAQTHLSKAAEEQLNHLRYEAGDVLYHLLVILARFDIPLDELAAELNSRMTDAERPRGAVRLHAESINRGK